MLEHGIQKLHASCTELHEGGWVPNVSEKTAEALLRSLRVVNAGWYYRAWDFDYPRWLRSYPVMRKILIPVLKKLELPYVWGRVGYRKVKRWITRQ